MYKSIINFLYDKLVEIAGTAIFGILLLTRDSWWEWATRWLDAKLGKQSLINLSIWLTLILLVILCYGAVKYFSGRNGRKLMYNEDDNILYGSNGEKYCGSCYHGWLRSRLSRLRRHGESRWRCASELCGMEFTPSTNPVKGTLLLPGNESANTEAIIKFE